MRSSPLAALIVCAACSKDGDSTATPSEESDSDTDADSDTDSDTDADSDTDSDTDADSDTDTDTDPEGWHANAVFVDGAFGFDADTAEIRTMTSDGSALPNVLWVFAMNYYPPYPVCFVRFDLPDGPIVPVKDFGAPYWFGFDLSTATVSWEDGAGGDICEHMLSLGSLTRGSKDLATFVATWDVSFGVESLDEVDAVALARWEKSWPTSCHDCGSWSDMLPHLAAGAFLFSGLSAPWAGEAVWASPVDPATGETDPSTLLPLGTATAAPTAYYTAHTIEGVGL